MVPDILRTVKRFLSPCPAILITTPRYSCTRSLLPSTIRYATVTVPGQSEPVYIVNEMNKTTVQLSVGGDGRLTEQGIICPYGQYSNVTDADGNVYVADGEIFVYDKYGKEQRRIQIEERPISLAIGGRQKDMLFVTTSSSFYGIKIR